MEFFRQFEKRLCKIGFQDCFLQSILWTINFWELGRWFIVFFIILHFSKAVILFLQIHLIAFKVIRYKKLIYLWLWSCDLRKSRWKLLSLDLCGFGRWQLSGFDDSFWWLLDEFRNNIFFSFILLQQGLVFLFKIMYHIHLFFWRH